MNPNWNYEKIGDVMLVERGGSPRPINKYLTDSPDGLNWIKISDATASDKYIYKTKQKILKEGLHKTRLVNEGDFLLSNSMSFGRPYIMKTSGCIHDGWLVLKEKEAGLLDKDFLYHLLGSPYIFEQFDDLAAGSTVRNLNIGLVSSVSIPIPPLEEQKQIVAVLDKAFAAIDLAKANIEKNLQNAKELFQSKLNQIFTQKGEGWEDKKLGEVCDVRDGTHDSPKYQDSGFPLITSKNLKQGLITFDKVKFISEVDLLVINKRSKVNVGDILFAMIGTIGNPVVIIEEPNYAIKNVALFKPTSCLNSFFLKYLLDSPAVINQMQSEAKGTTQKFVGLGYLRNFWVRVPSYKEQCKIVQELDMLSAQTLQLESQYQLKLDDLDDLKKSILQKAFTGELISTNALKEGS